MALGAAGRCIVRHGAQVFCLQGFSALSGEVGERTVFSAKGCDR